jgi:MFS family permease
MILDSQIVILGVPSIERDLGFSADGVQWVLSAYLLSFGGLLLLGGPVRSVLTCRRPAARPSRWGGVGGSASRTEGERLVALRANRAVAWALRMDTTRRGR